jgi:NAD(P)-dependent dehydrogenase (short-subunit alcohol dehydrogenase family)
VKRFGEKGVLVTGAASRIGQATVQRQLEEGAYVVGLDLAEADRAGGQAETSPDKRARVATAAEATGKPSRPDDRGSYAHRFGRGPTG